MRLASYPFDWLCSELSIVESCIKDSFKDFLDKDLYNRYGTECEHKLYSSKGRPLFYHHDPQGNEEDYQRFCRGANRFLHLLKQTESKLFIYMDVNSELKTTREEVISFNNTLKEHTSNYTLLSILHKGNNEERSYKYDSYESIDFLELNTVSTSDGSCFSGDDHTLMEDAIKERYSFDLLPLHK